MDKSMEKECKQKLEDRRDELLSAKEAPYDETLEEQVGELTTFDNHPGDMGTELFERERDMALEERKEQELLQIEKALDRLANGEYGKCEICGKEIHEERLRAIPETTYCIDHATEI